MAIIYATLDAATIQGNHGTLSDGNLTWTKSVPPGFGSGWASVRANQSKSSGKWYFEVTNNGSHSSSSAYLRAGVLGGTQTAANPVGTIVIGTVSAGAVFDSSGTSTTQLFVWVNAVPFLHYSDTGIPDTITDILMVAVDLDNGRLWFGVNGTWVHSSTLISDPIGDPAGGTAITTGWAGGTSIVPKLSLYGVDGEAPSSLKVNFGASAFAYTPPAGFNAGWYTESFDVTGQQINVALGTVICAGATETASPTGFALTASVGSVETVPIDAPVDSELYISEEVSRERTVQAGAVSNVRISSASVGYRSFAKSGASGIGISSVGARETTILAAAIDILGIEALLSSSSTYDVFVTSRFAFVSRSGISGGESTDAVSDGTTATASWVINLNTNAVSRYMDFGFESMCEFSGNTYVAEEHSLYTLSSNTSVDASCITPRIIANENLQSRVEFVYLGVKSDHNLLVKAVLQGDEEYVYDTGVSHSCLHPIRVKLGEKLKSRSWEFEIYNTYGAATEIQSFGVLFRPTNRRI